jgi:glycosyltransferase involved in cell wall biosynthesis
MGDHLVIDNKPSIDYFRREFSLAEEDFSYIPYGADLEPPAGVECLESLGLAPRGYLLFVGALLPDKAPDILVDAYRRVATELPLVIAGDSPFAPEYRDRLRAAAAEDPRIRMLGYVYGEAYRELVANSYAYIHPARKEGTSPALLQAMGYGSCVVTNSSPELLAVVGDGALTFARDDPADLARQLQRVIDDHELAESLRAKALDRVRTEYNWDNVTAAHRSVYERVLGRGADTGVAAKRLP